MKTVVIFMLCWMVPVASPMVSDTYGTVVLDMAKQSVDDMYQGCTDKMAKKVECEYFPREMKDKDFAKAWNLADATAQRKFNKRQDKDLTKDDIQAIVVYSKENPDVYTPFNAAVRDGRPKYTTSFPYHALHFWLTSVVHILNPKKQCYATYRRSKMMFKGKINQEFRFGSFTSTSKKPDLYRFGKETCFQIETCFGAYLKDYPVLGDYEQEVLIPPYEKFKIIKIAEKSYQALTDCKKIFVVKSTGVLSDLNCKASYLV